MNTSAFGLDEKDIQKIKNVFSKHANIKTVILYGSRAKGNYKPGSDIDLTIVTNDMSYLELNKIKNELDELNLPYVFDLSIFSEIENQDLIKHIERVGIPF